MCFTYCCVRVRFLIFSPTLQFQSHSKDTETLYWVNAPWRYYCTRMSMCDDRNSFTLKLKVKLAQDLPWTRPHLQDNDIHCILYGSFFSMLIYDRSLLCDANHSRPELGKVTLIIQQVQYFTELQTQIIELICLQGVYFNRNRICEWFYLVQSKRRQSQRVCRRN